MDQLWSNPEVLQRVKTELAVWDVCLNFGDLQVFKFAFTKVKIFGVHWEPDEFLEGL